MKGVVPVATAIAVVGLAVWVLHGGAGLGGIVARFWRALRRRCPHCGGGPVTERWLQTRPACPVCHIKLDRGEADYFLGAIVFNMAFSEGIFAAGLFAVLFLTWPHPPWDTVYYGGIVGMIIAPIFFYPYSKLCWLAFDLQFRPPRPQDFEVTTPTTSSTE